MALFRLFNKGDDASRQNLRRRAAEAAAYNTKHSGLYNLPAELLAIVNDYLSLVTGLVLRRTCSKFYQSSIFCGNVQRADQADRFKVLCISEGDEGAFKGYRCMGCLRSHSYTAFSNEELVKKAYLRYCLATMKCFRVGLFRELSFAEVKKALDEQKKNGPQYKQICDCNDEVSSVFKDGRIFHFNDERCIHFSFRMCRSSQLSQLSSAHYFSNLCRSFNIPLCPHMNMGDQEVAGLFFRDNRYRHKCKRCKTHVRLVNNSGPLAFFLVTRELGKLASPKDPTWLAHTFASKNPLLDTHCIAVQDWHAENPIRFREPLEQLQLLRRENSLTPGFNNLFTAVTLPRISWGEVIRRGCLGGR